MRVLFIGGTRFIGRQTAIQLIESGHDVTVFHRGKSDTPMPESVKHILGDMAQLEDFQGQFTKIQPDVIIHMMLLTEEQTQKHLEVLQGVSPRIVVISSVDVYQAWGRILGIEAGDLLPIPLADDSPLREKLYPYRDMGEQDWRHDYDKILVERVVMQSDKILGTVIRLPMVYGEYDYQRRLAGYLQRMEDEREIILVDERAKDWIAPRGYIDNIARAIMLAAISEKGANRIYHVANPHAAALTEMQWINAIGQAAGWQGEVRPVPPELLPETMQFNPNGQSISLDSSRLRQELAFSEITSLEDGLRRTVDWDREHILPNQPPIDYRAEDEIIAKLS